MISGAPHTTTLDVSPYESAQVISTGLYSEVRVIRGGLDHCASREGDVPNATSNLLTEVNDLMEIIPPAMPVGCVDATFSIGTERLPGELIPYLLRIHEDIKDTFPMYDCVHCHLGPPTMMLVHGCEFVLGHGDLYIVVNNPE
jgi:hypothetical protein